MTAREAEEEKPVIFWDYHPMGQRGDKEGNKWTAYPSSDPDKIAWGPNRDGSIANLFGRFPELGKREDYDLQNADE